MLFYPENCEKLFWKKISTSIRNKRHFFLIEKKRNFEKIVAIFYKRKNLYQVALLSTFYKGDHGGLIIQ